MNYRRAAPDSDLAGIVECFWMVDDDDVITIRRQKIVPDGYTELIFHFGDPYRIQLDKIWEQQANALVAGQIKKHFFLENTGASHIFGIKLKPTALTHLFGLQMDDFTDRVIDINRVSSLKELTGLQEILSRADAEGRISIVENFFRTKTNRMAPRHPADAAVDHIFREHGMVTIKEIASRADFTERYIEQLFRKYVGLTPKLFARIIRFSYIFQLINDNRPDWSDVAFQSGFYDQSHFIRNFKSFTGEDPSKYLFSTKDLANFFLKTKQTG